MVEVILGRLSITHVSERADNTPKVLKQTRKSSLPRSPDIKDRNQKGSLLNHTSKLMLPRSAKAKQLHIVLKKNMKIQEDTLRRKEKKLKTIFVLRCSKVVQRDIQHLLAQIS